MGGALYPNMTDNITLAGYLARCEGLIKLKIHELSPSHALASR